MFSRWTYLLVGILVFTLSGCGGESGGNNRIELPFESIRIGNSDVSPPSGTVMKIEGEGSSIPWPPDPDSFVYESPVHPIGHIGRLQIDGVDVALESSELRDGMLATEQFGEIEVLASGPTRMKFFATRSQVRKIKKWIDKTR